MAHAYTPGLKVLRETYLERARILPLKGEVKVTEGQKVKPDDIVCATALPGNVQMVNVANILNVEPGEVPEMMLKQVGDTVQEGEVIAETPGLFGLFKTRVNAPTSGTIESISNVTGQVVIREAPIPVEIDAYLEGEIKKVLPGEGVIIGTYGAFIQGIFGIGGESRGELAVVVDDRSAELTPELIKPEHKGRILVGGSFVSLEAYRKASNLGVAGIVVGGFDFNRLKDILGYTLGVAITGSEELTTSLILTEGFGRINMARRTFELLQKYDGRFASINGATQIRAGVIRPEIVIPLREEELSGQIQEKDFSKGMEVGSLVRVIRAPYFGRIGRVTALPAELQQMESETMVRVAVVTFNDGTEAVLPRANLEMVETD